MTTCDVVVVGAGAAGSAAAWWLARSGRRVVLVDRFEAGHLRGSSHGTERIFRLAYAEPAYVELAVEALPLWRELEADTGASLLRTTGGLDSGSAEELAAIEVACASHGIGVSWWSETEARRAFGGLHLAGPILHQADAGRTDADLTLRTLQGRARALGAELRFSERVEAIEPREGSVVVRSEGGTIEAETCIVAAGAWAERLLSGVVDLPPITVTQEQVAFFRPTVDAAWPCFVERTEPSRYGLGTPGGLVKIGEHYTGPVVDPDERTFEVEPATWDRLLAWVPEHLPGVDPTPVGSTTCLYASTADEDFIIDRVGQVIVAAGLGGHGFKFTPAIGRHLAELSTGEGWPGNRFALGRAALAVGRSGHK